MLLINSIPIFQNAFSIFVQYCILSKVHNIYSTQGLLQKHQQILQMNFKHNFINKTKSEQKSINQSISSGNSAYIFDLQSENVKYFCVSGFIHFLSDRMLKPLHAFSIQNFSLFSCLLQFGISVEYQWISMSNTQNHISTKQAIQSIRAHIDKQQNNHVRQINFGMKFRF